MFGITDPIAPADSVPFQPWARALYDERQQHELEPHTRCKASGVARQFLTPYGVEFVELPEIKRIFIFDIGGPHTYRTVYMDGRSHPRDLTPSYYGHSIGWWDGDTLVVDSMGFNEAFWLDRRGLPHTEAMHTVERFKRMDAETVEYEITVYDEGAYTAPWSGGFALQWDKGQELFEYVCHKRTSARDHGRRRARRAWIAAVRSCRERISGRVESLLDGAQLAAAHSENTVRNRHAFRLRAFRGFVPSLPKTSHCRSISSAFASGIFFASFNTSAGTQAGIARPSTAPGCFAATPACESRLPCLGELASLRNRGASLNQRRPEAAMDVRDLRRPPGGTRERRRCQTPFRDMR